jgi:hypothetical protein
MALWKQGMNLEEREDVLVARFYVVLTHMNLLKLGTQREARF